MDYYAGLDVSLRSVVICIVDSKGKVVLEQSVTFEIAEITACLNNFAQPLALVGFEAGAMSRHLFSGLQAEGFETVCMEARQVNAALSAMRNKTDRTDARGIAQVLRAGWFNPVHIKSREAHLIRALLSSRKAVRQKCIDLANEIRGLFRVFGLRLPSRVEQRAFDGMVRPIIEADPDLSRVLLPLLDARAALYQTYQEPDRRVNQAASRDAICLRFMEIPGVGSIAALTFRAAVDDPSRFLRSRTVAAHFGQTPRRFQSGEKDIPGRISKAGDTGVRSVLYAAANAMLMRSVAGSAIKSWGMRLLRRKVRRRAIVAVARKLAVVMHRMWVDGTEFRRGLSFPLSTEPPCAYSFRTSKAAAPSIIRLSFRSHHPFEGELMISFILAPYGASSASPADSRGLVMVSAAVLSFSSNCSRRKALVTVMSMRASMISMASSMAKPCSSSRRQARAYPAKTEGGMVFIVRRAEASPGYASHSAQTAFALNLRKSRQSDESCSQSSLDNARSSAMKIRSSRPLTWR